LGLILGVSFLVIGEISMNVNAELEIGAFDGFWLILGMPIVATLIFVLVSPMSFFIHKLLSEKRSKRVQSDA